MLPLAKGQIKCMSPELTHEQTQLVRSEMIRSISAFVTLSIHHYTESMQERPLPSCSFLEESNQQSDD